MHLFRPHLTVQEPLMVGETIRLSTAKQELEARVRKCVPAEDGYAVFLEILHQGAGFGNHRLTAAFLGAAGAVVGLFLAVLLSISSGTVGHAKAPPEIPADAAAEVPGPPPLPGEAIEYHLKLRAADLSWVTACADGKKIFERLFRQGDTADIPYFETAIVRAGNAAGLEVTVGSRPLGAMGPQGAIRVLRADGENYAYIRPVLDGACQVQ